VVAARTAPAPATGAGDRVFAAVLTLPIQTVAVCRQVRVGAAEPGVAAMFGPPGPA
jgi:hypothetical protein